jgi:hypothetical protein
MKNKRTLTALVFAIFIVSCSFFSGCGIINNPGSTVNYKLSWSNPIPQGNALNGVFFVDADNAFAVGLKGSIARYSSGEWTVMESNTTHNLWKVWGYDVNNVFAVGTDGTVMRYDGTSWTRMNQSLDTGILQAVWGTSPNDLFVGSNNGVILHYDGAKWTSSDELSEGYITGILGFSANNIYAISNIGQIFRFDGTRWSLNEDLGDYNLWLTGIWGDAADNIYVSVKSLSSAAEDLYLVYHYDGTSWTGMKVVFDGVPCNVGLNGIWGTSSDNLLVVGGLGLIARYDGHQWTDEGIFGGQHLYEISGSANGIVAVGQIGTIVYYDGTEWSLVCNQFAWDMHCIWGSSANDIFAAGDHGEAIHYNGTEWTKMGDTGVDHTIRGIWGTSSSNVYAVGGISQAGFIIRYDGTSWSTIMDDLDFIPYAIHGTGSDDIYIVGDRVMHFNGTEWNTEALDLPSTLYAVWANDEHVFVAGSSGFMRYLNKRTAWNPLDFKHMNSGTNSAVTSILGFSSKEIFMGDLDGNLLSYDGTKWSIKDSNVASKIIAIWGTSANNMYLTSRDEILHWDGVSYRTLDNILEHKIFSIWGASENDVFFAGEYATILRYGPR